MWSSPRAFAPLIVAISRAAWAEMAVGSRVTPLLSRAARRISFSIFRALLLAAPSVPRATFMPLSRYFWMGAMPLASLRLELGQWVTEELDAAMMAISSSVRWTPWAILVTW